MNTVRKAALCTTSLVAMGAFSTAAQAEEWDVKVGGYFEAYAAFATNDVSGADPDLDGVDVKTDAEITFVPSITLDNGLKISANIQVETNGDSGGDVDEAFLFIEGSFGRILLGEHNSAGYIHSYGAPDASLLTNRDPNNFEPESVRELSDIAKFIGGAFDGTNSVSLGSDGERATLGTTFIENDANDDPGRITYFTPRFSGFQLGASYARDGNGNNSQENCEFTTCDFIDLSANYLHATDAYEFGITGRYGTASGSEFADDDPTIYGVSAQYKTGPWTIAGGYAEQEGTPTADGTSYEIGAAYATGPWTYSLSYFHGENADNEHAFASGGDEFEEELDTFTAALDYKLAKGVRLNLFGAYVDFNEDIGDGGPSTAGNDAESFVIGTGIGLSF